MASGLQLAALLLLAACGPAAGFHATLQSVMAQGHGGGSHGAAAGGEEAAEAVRGQAHAAVARPNGPMLMNLTRMRQRDLPTNSRHINQETVIADWLDEYPVDPEAELPEPAPVPARAPVVAPTPEVASRELDHQEMRHVQQWPLIVFPLLASALILVTLGFAAAK
mmetsp:Transcript_40396/g.128403  ORF Transcript_40396/g.128403 Transcript_40396/m.128403 type:complete len:166 (+) Transcript_40396:78-575(+)